MILLIKGENMKNYIKLNNNNNHLSLGNLFNIIKKISVNKTAAIQTEIFCTLFNIDNISETTIGNYCTGYRAINSRYKQIYITYQLKFPQNNEILLPTINNLISIIDGYITNYQTIEQINNNNSIKTLTKKLHSLAKNDIYVPSTLKKEIINYLNDKNYYLALCKMLFFIILEKKQPLLPTEEITTTIEEILEKTNLSVNSLKDYLTLQFKEGINLIPSLKELAKNKNPYALLELGNLEYCGLISGYPRYLQAYNYYLSAANFEHPTANWMIAHMIINQKIGSKNNDEINLAWKHLNKAIKLGSISALNTMGLCYLKGTTPEKKKDPEKAKHYFLLAAKQNYYYAYNNLGKIEEENKNYSRAFEYYLISANHQESWACNKVGEYYRQGIYIKKDLSLAYHYYNLGLNSGIYNNCPWNAYNLAKYFYATGSAILEIEKDLPKAIKLLETNQTNEESQILLLYLYYELYLNTKEKDLLNKVNHQLNIINNLLLDPIKKEEITNTLQKINSSNIKLP